MTKGANGSVKTPTPKPSQTGNPAPMVAPSTVVEVRLSGRPEISISTVRSGPAATATIPSPARWAAVGGSCPVVSGRRAGPAHPQPASNIVVQSTIARAARNRLISISPRHMVSTSVARLFRLDLVQATAVHAALRHRRQAVTNSSPSGARGTHGLSPRCYSVRRMSRRPSSVTAP
jgi:hypothetical protein